MAAPGIVLHSGRFLSDLELIFSLNEHKSNVPYSFIML